MGATTRRVTGSRVLIGIASLAYGCDEDRSSECGNRDGGEPMGEGAATSLLTASECDAPRRWPGGAPEFVARSGTTAAAGANGRPAWPKVG